MDVTLFESDQFFPGFEQFTQEAMEAFLGTFMMAEPDIQYALLRTILPTVRVNHAEGLFTASSLMVLLTEGPEAQNNWLRAEAALHGVDLSDL